MAQWVAFLSWSSWKRGTWGFTVLRYWAIFFQRYFGNLDYNGRYCGIIQRRGMRFFTLVANGIRWKKIVHGIAVLFIWPLLSMVGQYLKEFRLNGKWIHNFWQLLYDEIGRTSNDLAFRSMYRSVQDLLTFFSRRLWLISGVYMLDIKKHARWIQR